jgi:hypothetical protein
MPQALRDSLAEYPRIMLEAIAEGWGVALTDEQTPEIVDRLAAEMVNPDSVQFVLRRLGEMEREALAYVAALGQVKAHVMTRKYGAIRRLGPGRLEWEAAWRQPISAAERLWFLGLICREYGQDESYHGEVLYIPADLRAALPPMSIELPIFRVEPATSPTVMQDDGDALAHDVYVVLTYIRKHEVRARTPESHRLVRAASTGPAPFVASDGGATRGRDGLRRDSKGYGVPKAVLTARELTALRPRLAGSSDPQEPSLSAREYGVRSTYTQRLRLLLHLCTEAGLIGVKEGLWTPTAEAAAWLKERDIARQRTLYQAWLGDVDWNELWLLPGLRCEDTGWRNDPLLPRQVVLDYLRQCPVAMWLTIHSFVDSIHEVAPDLMRPDGDYDSWYIRDAQTGQYLMGWGSWPKVEGALIRYLLEQPLRWLGVVATGQSEGEAHASRFMLTQQGGAMLGRGEAAPTPEGGYGVPSRPQRMTVQADLQVTVPRGASWYDRFLLERFAEWMGEKDGTARYRMDAGSVRACLSSGVTLPQILAFLRRVSGNRLPAAAVRSLQSWAAD